MKSRRKHRYVLRRKRKHLCPPDWEGMVVSLGLNVVENPDWLVGAD